MGGVYGRYICYEVFGLLDYGLVMGWWALEGRSFLLNLLTFRLWEVYSIMVLYDLGFYFPSGFFPLLSKVPVPWLFYSYPFVAFACLLAGYF